jgi:Domain of unknown function (DUF4189)
VKTKTAIVCAGLFIAATATSLAVSKPVRKAAPAAAKPAGPVAAKYGALAVDRAKGFVYGFSFDHPSRTAASQFALQECAKRDGNCAVVIEFAGPGCAAYRTIDARNGSAYGWGTAPTQAAAEARAATECNSFGGGAACTNSVWACNSSEPAAFKVLRSDPVKRAKGPKDCLVQYELQLEDAGDNWKSRFYSPVYRLAAQDCALAGNSEYHSFYYNVWSGGINSGESNEQTAPKNPALKAKGIAMAKDFYSWFANKRSPVNGLKIRPSAGMTSSVATDNIQVALLDNTGGHDAGDSARYADGLCIAFAPPGVAPLEVLGAEKCRRWLR